MDPNPFPFVEKQRVRLIADLDRYPDFIAKAPNEGTVVWVDDETMAVRFETPILGAEEWHNEVTWIAEEDDILVYLEAVDGD